MRGLILSAYDAGSHARWRRAVVDLSPGISWHVETLPARFFKWRYRGNALTWGAGDFPDDRFDLLVATSATNLAALLGLRPELSDAHKVVYFHENQFIYPTRDDRGLDAHFAIQEILTASCADRVVFNSEFNRRTFLEGAASFLARLPDAVPSGVVEAIAAKASVVPVPVEVDAAPRRGERGSGPLRIVWNHRWEHDKGPQLLRDSIAELLRRTQAFELHVVGERFRSEPEAFAELRELAHDHIASWGYIEQRAHYIDLLKRADVVLSTAHHEFQGLAVLEAMMCGCRALTPDDLVYPEYVPSEDRYDPTVGAEAVAAVLEEWARDAEGGRWSAPSYDLSGYGRNALAPRYAAIFGLG